MERLAPLSRRDDAESFQIEPLERPVDAVAFVNHPATAEVVAALLGAAAQGRVHFGGIETAVQVLQSSPCPQVLIIDIAGVRDPLGQLNRLADFCPQGTGVVLVGSSQDPDLAAELQSMGILHYLTIPVDPQRMREAILDAAGSMGPDSNGYRNHTTDLGLNGEHADMVRSHLANGASTAATGIFSSDSEPTPRPGPEAIDAQHGANALMVDPVRDSLQLGAENSSDDAMPPALGYSSHIPPPATTQMLALAEAPTPSLPASGIDPLPRPVDLLAFMAEAQSASLVAAIMGAHGAAGRIQPGGINGAIAFLKDNASPKVLLVDISGVPEPMARIDILAEVCSPGTMVIATGVANDVALYRDLKNAGIYEYLVKPIQPEALKAVVLEAAFGGAKVELDAAKPVLMVIGARGGVGASTVAINLAGTLARQGKKTILLDLDLQFGSVALTLDIDPGNGLREALDRPERVDSMFLNSSSVKISDNLYVLAAEEGVSEAVTVNSESLTTLLHELQRHFDAIVVDLPRHVAASNWESISRAHAVLILADLSLVGIRDTTRLLTASKDAIDPAKIKLVISSTGGDRGAKIDRKEFEAALSRKVDYVLPEDSKSVGAANRAGRTIVDVASGSKLAVAMRDICVELVGGPEEGHEGAKKRRSIGLFRRRKKA